MQENKDKKKLTFKDVKDRIVAGQRSFIAFFKGFKWDKVHVVPLVKYVTEILLFVFIITFDLLMKDFLYDFVQVEHGGNFTVIDGFLDLTYSENTGMGFGLGQDSTLGITILTTILIIAILGYLIFFKKERAYIRIPLIMVAAGGIGNLVDRTQLGYVRDFFEFTFMDFAIFNIADAFVTVGAIVLILGLIVTMFFPSKDKRVSEEDETPEEEGKEGSAPVAFTAEEEVRKEDAKAPDGGVESPENRKREGTYVAKAAFTLTEEKPEEVSDGARDESDGER